MLPPFHEDPQRPRVLIVDDDDDVRTALGAVLEQEGYAVDMCTDGSQALAAARKNPPLLILLDVSMPTTNGFALLGELQGERSSRKASIIVVTSLRVFTSSDLGVDAVVFKPFDVDKLIDKIRAIVAPRSRVTAITKNNRSVGKP